MAATRTFTILFGGLANIEPRYFWDDSPVNDHADATEADCAAEARRYIESHGIEGFLRDWNLDGDLTVHVNGEQAWP